MLGLISKGFSRFQYVRSVHLARVTLSASVSTGNVSAEAGQARFSSPSSFDDACSSASSNLEVTTESGEHEQKDSSVNALRQKLTPLLKPPRSTYMFFVQQKFASMQGSVKRAATVSQQWKNLSDEEKKQYVCAAKAHGDELRNCIRQLTSEESQVFKQMQYEKRLKSLTKQYHKACGAQAKAAKQAENEPKTEQEIATTNIEQVTATKEMREKLAPLLKRPQNTYTFFFQQMCSSTQGSLKERFLAISAQWKRLTAEEKNVYSCAAKAQQDEHRARIRQLTPEEARVFKQLKNEKQQKGLKDSVLRNRKKHLKELCSVYVRPKKPLNPFYVFSQSLLKSSELSTDEWNKVVHDKWAAIDPDEKKNIMANYKVVVDQFREDLKQWEQKMIAEGHGDIVKTFKDPLVKNSKLRNVDAEKRAAERVRAQRKKEIAEREKADKKWRQHLLQLKRKVQIKAGKYNPKSKKSATTNAEEASGVKTDLPLDDEEVNEVKQKHSDELHNLDTNDALGKM